MVVGRQLFRQTNVWVAVGGVIGLIMWLFVLSGPAFAVQTTPYKVNYQGRLTNAHGAARLDGQYNMTFRLYTVASGGSAIWTEVRETTNRVTLTNGQFKVQLGDVTALSPSVFTTQPLYFEVELPTPASVTCSTAACAVYTEGAMTPRQVLGSSAYTMNSDTIDGYDTNSFIIANQNNVFTGTNLFKNTADSTSAFDAQTTGSVSLLKFDTTNSRVSIGTTGAGSHTLVTSNNGQVGIGIGTASPGATVKVGGNVLFENTADSTTALQVTNTAASRLFGVDTTNSRVLIGPATADATATLLVLDTKNTTGDPTVADGAMYYNSATGRARCGEQGRWINCTGWRIATLGSDLTTTSGTYVDVTGLSFPVIAGQTYNFYALIRYTAEATDAGSAWSINGPATTQLAYGSMYTITATTTTLNAATAYNVPAAANAGALVAGNIAKIKGVLTPAANGTVVVRVITTGSGSRSVTAKAGSVIMWW